MKRESGFTLIEVMIVVAVIGVLAAVAIPKLDLFRLKALRIEGVMMVRSVYTAELNYQATYEKFLCYEPASPAVPPMYTSSMEFLEILGLVDYLEKKQVKYYFDLLALGNNDPNLGPIGFNFSVYGELDDDTFKDVLFIRSELDQNAYYPGLNLLDHGVWHLVADDLSNKILVQ